MELIIKRNTRELLPLHESLTPAPTGFALAHLFLVSGLVLYGSMLPFSFHGDLVNWRNPLAGLHMGLGSTSFEDLLTNFLVYLPIGAIAATLARWSGRSISMRLLLGIALGFSLSLFSELTQIANPARVASMLDIFVNTAGAALGAVVALSLFRPIVRELARIRHLFSTKPFTTVSAMLTLGVFLFALVPFDFITTTAELHAAFRCGFSGVTSGTTAMATEAFAKPMIAAAWFGALGYAWSLAAKERGRAVAGTLLSVAEQGLVLAGVIEVLQFFTKSHVFDLSMFAIEPMAAILGAWLAILLTDGTTAPAWARRRRLALPTILLTGALVGHVGVFVLSDMGWRHGSLGSIDWSRVFWVPFEALWRGSLGHVTSQITSSFVTYGTLTLTTGILLRRAGTPSAWVIAGAFTVVLATFVESLQLLMMYGTPDVTQPILALAATVVSIRGYELLAGRSVSARAGAMATIDGSSTRR